jgi:predicted Rossmann-fold nucleotide-binding protein
MAWGLARLYFGRHKPLILYGEFWNEIIKSFKKNMRIRPEDLKVYKVVKTPEDAYRAIQIFEEALEKQNNVHKEEEAFQL